MSDTAAYPGSPSLSPEAREKVLQTFRHTLELAKSGRNDEALLGCDFILKMDSRFAPARKLLEMLRGVAAGTIIDTSAFLQYVSPAAKPAPSVPQGSTVLSPVRPPKPPAPQPPPAAPEPIGFDFGGGTPMGAPPAAPAAPPAGPDPFAAAAAAAPAFGPDPFARPSAGAPSPAPAFPDFGAPSGGADPFSTAAAPAMGFSFGPQPASTPDPFATQGPQAGFGSFGTPPAPAQPGGFGDFGSFGMPGAAPGADPFATSALPATGFGAFGTPAAPPPPPDFGAPPSGGDFGSFGQAPGPGAPDAFAPSPAPGGFGEFGFGPAPSFPEPPGSPFGAAPASPQADPFAAFGGGAPSAPPADPFAAFGGGAPSAPPADPFAAFGGGAPSAPPADPFAAFGGGAPSAPPADPFAAFGGGAPSAPPADPFAAFGAGPASLGPSAPPSAAPGVDPRITQFLKQGDEAIARGQVQEAIDLWSRVFLIDLSNEDASRRIDQARERLAQSAQQVDMLVSEGMQLFDRGDLATARSKFLEVLTISEGDSTARSYLAQIDAAMAGAGGGAAAMPSSYSSAPEPASYEEPEPLFVPAAEGIGLEEERAPERAAPVRKGGKLDPKILAGVCVVVLLAIAGGLYFFTGGKQAPAPPPPVATKKGPAQPVGEDLVGKAQSLFDQGRVDEALQILVSIPDSDPRHAEALAMIDRFKTTAIPTPAAAGATVDYDQLKAQGLASIKASRYIDAVRSLDPVVKARPEDSEAALALAKAREEISALGAALKAYNDQDYSTAVKLLYPIYTKDKKNQDAEEFLFRSFFNDGIQKMQAGTFKEASESFLDASKLRPSDQEAQRHLRFTKKYPNGPDDLLSRIYVKHAAPRL